MQSRLTPQQQASVEHVEGPALVFAVAGAGKTTELVHRIANLVNQKHCAPTEILVTIFNKATQLELAQSVQAQ